MSQVLQNKVVAALPDPLEANAIYYVRVGSGFDVYITNDLGTVSAYSHNAKLAVNDLDSRVGVLEADGGGSALFSVEWWPKRSTIPAGFVPADGQLLNRATYFEAAEGVTSGVVPVVADSAWTADPLLRGNYTAGDGAATFRLPDYNGQSAGAHGALFLRGGASEGGLIQRDAMQGHWHSAYSGTSSGAGSTNPTRLISGVNNTEILPDNTVRSAISDGVNGTPRIADETRSLNVGGVWVIKLFGALTNAGSADAAQLATDVGSLQGELSTLDGQLASTIIYPNGGADIGINSRYVESNPFPGHNIIVEVEVLVDGSWGGVSWIYSSAANKAYGVVAHQYNDTIVVSTGAGGLSTATVSFAGMPHLVSAPNNAPCRVKVWKVKGVAA